MSVRYADMSLLPAMQAVLSRAQAVPIVGPLLVSPVKAVASVLQIAIGIFSAISLGLSAALTGLRNLDKRTVQALSYASLGYLSFCYAAINMNTLGIFGFLVEFVLHANPGFL